MKILQINKFFYKRGGAEAYMLSLIDLLRANGHQVMEFSMAHPQNLASKYSQYFVNNVDLNKREGVARDLAKAGHLLYSTEAAKKLEKLIQKDRPDIAHLHNFYFQLTPSIVAVLKKYQIPMVWTMHDYKLICPNYKLFTQGHVCEKCKIHKYYNCARLACLKNNFSYSVLAMAEAYLNNYFLGNYDKIDLYISPSKFLAQKVTEWGISADKVKQLYNFINLADFTPSAEPGTGLLYFGRLSEEKGLMTLLEAMKQLPEINLQIVGTGPQKEQVEDFVVSNAMANVQLIDHIVGPKLQQIISQARLVVVPSVWYENNPISILEAFALARPVLGADLGGIPELVQPDKTGILFKAGDSQDLVAKIKTYYVQTDLLRQLGQNARLWVEANCQPAKHYQALEALYQIVLKSAKSG